jgi:uncharacterized protein (TIGR03000 family)
MRSLLFAAAAALAVAAPALAQRGGGGAFGGGAVGGGRIGFAGPSNPANPTVPMIPFKPYVPPTAVGAPLGQPALAIFPDLATYYAFAPFYRGFPQAYAATQPVQYVPVPVDYTPPPPDPASDPERAKVTLQVPQTAEVFVEGQKINQIGSTREFLSPPLEAGHRYHYAVVVRFSDKGKTVEKKFDVPVRAGDRPVLMVVAPTAL